MPDIAYYETLRVKLVEQEYNRLLNEALNDVDAFDSLDSEYEVCAGNSSQIQRALRNLGDAIKGKEHAQDAVFTALSYVMSRIKKVVHEQADCAVKPAKEMMFEGDQP